MTEKLEIFATLPKKSKNEFLTECINAGVTGIRIHCAKMNPEEVVELIQCSYSVGLKIMVDLPGIKGRTKDSICMVTDTEIGEFGNKYLPLKEGDIFSLVPAEIEDEYLNCVISNYIKISYIPNVLQIGDIVTFSDGQISCIIEEIIYIHGCKILQLKVTKLSGKKGIYWNMGLGSSSKYLFNGHTNVITNTDKQVLLTIRNANIQNQISKIALSFVTNAYHLESAIEILKSLEFDMKKIKLVAKIETVEAVNNIEEILTEIIDLKNREIQVIVEIGRGDLGDDCIIRNQNIDDQETIILELAKRYNVPVIIATNVALSAIETIKEKREFTSLTQIERERIVKELTYKIVIGFMLAGETMITGKEAIQVIGVVKNTLIEIV